MKRRPIQVERISRPTPRRKWLVENMNLRPQKPLVKSSILSNVFAKLSTKQEACVKYRLHCISRGYFKPVNFAPTREQIKSPI